MAIVADLLQIAIHHGYPLPEQLQVLVEMPQISGLFRIGCVFVEIAS